MQSLIDSAAPGTVIQLQDEVLQYPVILDKNVTIRGPANIKLGALGGSVFIGLQRAMNQVSNPLDATKFAYRTTNDRRIWLPAAPWNITPPVTIKLGFVINSLPTGQVGLFGSIEKQLPAPWFCFMDPNTISVWSSSGKYECRHIWTTGYHEVLVQITSTTTTIVVDGIPLNPFFTAPVSVPLPIRTASFGIGGVSDGMATWGDLGGGVHDFTYCGLIAVSGIVNIGSFWSNFTQPFCRLFCDSGQLVHCFGSTGHSYGAMVLTNQGWVPTPSFENVQFNVPFWVGACTNPQFWKCFFGLGFTSPGKFVTYPVDLASCTIQGLLRGSGEFLWMDRCLVDRMELHSCNIYADKVFMRGLGKTVNNVVECLESGQYQFSNLNMNYEGGGPSGSYVYAEKDPGKWQTELIMENCSVGAPAPQGDIRIQNTVVQSITRLESVGRTPSVVPFT